MFRREAVVGQKDKSLKPLGKAETEVVRPWMSAGDAAESTSVKVEQDRELLRGMSGRFEEAEMEVVLFVEEAVFVVDGVGVVMVIEGKVSWVAVA